MGSLSKLFWWGCFPNTKTEYGDESAMEVAVTFKGGKPIAERDCGRNEIHYWYVSKRFPFRSGRFADEWDVLASLMDYWCRSLPDSNIDAIIITKNVRADALKVVNALTVSTKYQEILQTVESDDMISIECKQSYSGISVHLELMPECNTSFSNFIHYAKRVSAFKPLYMVFRHFLKQGNIPSDGNHNMLIYLLLIYYLQISLG